jgi:hypothetical protein
MERGPMALFGAIIAVGLGPAMWLGAQLGNVTVAPTRPPTVSSVQDPGQGHNVDEGGGAGAAPEDPSIVIKTRPKADIKPLSPTPSARPSSSAPTSGSDDPGNPTGEPTETSPATPSDDPSTPPTEVATTQPTDPPTDGDDAPVVAPSPPAVNDRGPLGTGQPRA